ncbi:MAG TPA: glycosyltransferase family 2 protein [Candidatus Limnocylindria bacterium]|nr:glycosyltransferase family 2 protein [Candidatus Limnocylindria bacterium]
MSAAASPVAVIVLHWGVEADTLACLRSVAATGFPAHPLLVIDNGTGVPSDAAIAAVTPEAEVIRLPQNLGYTGGNNVGIRHALERGAASVVIVNNDATLDPACLDVLTRTAAAAGPSTAAVGAKVLQSADPSRLWMAYGRLTYRAALVERVGAGALDVAGPDHPHEVDWVSGCAVLLTREALEAVGLFDERFFAYHEDVDWCTAARARGFRVLYAPAARAFHRGGGSTAAYEGGAAVRYLCARNTVLFARKHARPLEAARLALRIGGSLPLAWLRELRRGGPHQTRDLLRGYRDGLLGRAVPYEALGLR